MSVISRASSELLKSHFSGHNPFLLFLDVDGTLSPIVSDPQKAIVPESTLEILNILAGKQNVHIIIISGRKQETLDRMFGENPSFSYASAHGYSIQLTKALGGVSKIVGEDTLPVLNAAQTALLAWTKTTAPSGLFIEHNHFALSLHYRNIVDPTPEALAMVETAVDECVTLSCGYLEKRAGKKVWELRPTVGWGKGEAVEWILEQAERYIGGPLNILVCGDDLTDEDMFVKTSQRDAVVSILVAPPLNPSENESSFAEVRKTSAKNFVASPQELASLLKFLTCLR